MLLGKLTKRTKGVPQASPISPLLSNILLHELDKELERQGLKFVRYADDFSIYVKSKAEAEICKSIYKKKMNGKWQISEITKKTAQLLKKLKIDYLND